MWGAIKLSAAAFAVTLMIPATATSRTLNASGWVPYWAQDEASRTIAAERDLFGSASPFWYSTDAAGKLHAAPGAGSPEVLERLRKASAEVTPTVTAPIKPRAAIKLFSAKQSRRAHVRRLVDLAKRYDGVDLNYEHPALTTRRGQARRVRDALNAVFRHACRAIERSNRACGVTVMPRTSSKRKTWRGVLTPWVYDYRAIGKAASTVRVMAYDQHAGSYGPGPVSSSGWTRRIARYSAKAMPAAKTELGLPLYGRQWRTGPGRSAEAAPRADRWQPFARLAGATEISSLTFKQAVRLKRSCGAKTRWSSRHDAPWFRCDGRKVWFSNARSTLVRARIAADFELAGVAFWAPYGEDPATWRKLRRSGLLGSG